MYSSKKSSNDFALLELDKEIDFQATKIGKIEFADSNLETSGGLEEGTMATVLGWGVTRENGSQPPIMGEVDVPLVSRERANAPSSYDGCARAMKYGIYSNVSHVNEWIKTTMNK